MTHFFTLPTKVHLEEGALKTLPTLVRSYGTRVFLVTTANHPPLDALYSQIKDELVHEGCQVFHFDRVQPNPPVDVIEAGIKEL